MKRLILTLLCGVLCLCLTACGTQEPEESGQPQRSEATVSEAISTEENTEDGPEQNIASGEDGMPEESTQIPPDKEQETETGLEETDMKCLVDVNGTSFTATLEENEATEALIGMMEQEPVTIRMSDYAGFEKVGPLGTSLPTSNQQTTTQAGDIVLYQGNQIVIFYGSNSWSYTRLGRIDDLTGWEEALGSGDVTVTFSLEE